MNEIIETDRLILRPFILADAKNVQKLAGNIEIAKTTLHVPHPYEDGMAEKWIETLIENRKNEKQFAYAIEIKNTKQFIGTCTIINNIKHEIAELAYWIGFEYWNNGYGTEASKALIKEAFQKLKIEKIFAAHLESNPSSGKLMEKTGMKKEGVLRKHVLKWDKRLDLIYYGILKEESKT